MQPSLQPLQMDAVLNDVAEDTSNFEPSDENGIFLEVERQCKGSGWCSCNVYVPSGVKFLIYQGSVGHYNKGQRNTSLTSRCRARLSVPHSRTDPTAVTRAPSATQSALLSPIPSRLHVRVLYYENKPAGGVSGLREIRPSTKVLRSSPLCVP